MKNYDFFMDSFIEELSKFDEIEGVLLSGSLTSKTTDDYSDIDLYIYLNRDLSVDKRDALISKYSLQKEVNNQFWETED